MPLQTFYKAINDGLHEAMSLDDNVICYAWVSRSKGVFGTTIGLEEQFGPDRVFDMPTSENAMTGIGVGAALYGMRPIITHQRLILLCSPWIKSSITQQNGVLCLAVKEEFRLL